MDFTISGLRKATATVMPATPAIVYSTLTGGIFAVISIVFLFFPRPAYSELEKRELATAPELTVDGLLDSSYMGEVSHWFNDSEPYRDRLMTLSMTLRDLIRINVGGDEAISFHAAEAEEDIPIGDGDAIMSDGDDGEIPKLALDDGVVKLAHKGIAVVGTAPTARAMMAYGGNGGGEAHAAMARRYAGEMPQVRIYSLVAPLASEFYLPEKARKASQPQIKTIENIHAKLGDAVTFVDAYGALRRHADEDIYLRTDHHWAPLGAYYAAQQLAKAAGVPFRALEEGYQSRTVRGFVGSMYGYSQDKAVKDSPEDFVYYVPTSVEYTTTYRYYKVNSSHRVTSEGAPVTSSFFKTFKDGSSGAYCTFMGGDMMLVKVQTGTHNGRRLLIIKDSYGNAVPGYMFYSFEEVHVVDFRYFTRNIRKYCSDNGITDLAFVFNIFNAYSPGVAARCEKFLTQGDNTFAAPDSDSATHGATSDSLRDGTKPADTPAAEPAAVEPAAVGTRQAVETPTAAPEPADDPAEEPTEGHTAEAPTPTPTDAPTENPSPTQSFE